MPFEPKSIKAMAPASYVPNNGIAEVLGMATHVDAQVLVVVVETHGRVLV